MSQGKLIAQGAEAKIFLDEKNNLITKERVSKSYRIKEIDSKIIKQRTKAETKLLSKVSEIVNAPKPIDSKEINKIIMPFIEGKKLSEYLDDFSLAEQKKICKQIGESVAKIHGADIIHGDLTTSNMILINSNSERSEPVGGRVGKSPVYKKFKIFFIDFGLGYISQKVEDKAVDLHLLKQALEAKHFKNWEILFKEFCKGYEKNTEHKKVFERLTAVERRGRYRH